ncbi:MAG: hypothetical protein EXQ86_05500 [Rhodospirillales bacterium]|nr:hypothetical protein [Rhodospirillales bacterium]
MLPGVSPAREWRPRRRPLRIASIRRPPPRRSSYRPPAGAWIRTRGFPSRPDRFPRTGRRPRPGHRLFAVRRP